MFSLALEGLSLAAWKIGNPLQNSEIHTSTKATQSPVLCAGKLTIPPWEAKSCRRLLELLFPPGPHVFVQRWLDQGVGAVALSDAFADTQTKGAKLSRAVVPGLKWP